MAARKKQTASKEKKGEQAYVSRIVGHSNESPKSLKAHPKNWRRHPVRQRKGVDGALEEVGWVDEVTVNRSTGNVIDGHLRLELALERGEQTVPVRWIEVTPAEELLILATLDPLGAMAQRREDRLADCIKGAKRTRSEQLEILLDRLKEGRGSGVPSKASTSRPPAPDAIEPPKIPKAKEGDLFRLGPHLLLVADSLDGGGFQLLKKQTGEAGVSAIVTDPPYAIYGSSTGVSSEVADDKLVRPFFSSLFRHIRLTLPWFGHAYVFCDWRSWPSVWEGARAAEVEPKNCIVWDKGDAGLGSNYANTHEFIGFFANLPKQHAMGSRASGQRPVYASNVIRAGRVRGDERHHNAAKPTEVLRQLIENSTEPDQWVLDPFAGSGQTLFAAHQVERRCLLGEIAPKWADVVCKRWEAMTGEEPELLEEGLSLQGA